MGSITRHILIVSALAIIASLFVGVNANVAQAAIRCDGPFQVIKSQGKIATPYCEDNYLAAVARGYGMRVSNRAIRQNPHKKQEACRLAGHDIRVADICSGYRGTGNGYR